VGPVAAAVASVPVVASFCADFLKSDMQHIYRQVSDLQAWKPCIITRRRENEGLFPWPRKQLRLLPKHPARFWRRLWFRQIGGRPVPPTWGEVKDFLYHVERFQAAVVHVYFGHIAVQWLRLLEVSPRPVVVSFHGADAAVGVSPETLRRVFSAARLVLARSTALLADLEALGCPREKLRLQRTGLSLDEWSPEPDPTRHEAVATAAREGRWHGVQTCRLVEKKGLITTLRAMAEIRKTWPQARLTLIGEGPQRPALEGLARELGMADAVTWAGFLPPEAILDTLRTAHLFFHPSETPADGNREGVPNSLLEAMACALPVLATRHGGIPEAVDDGVAGFLVAERDAAGLAAAGRRLLADESLRLACGAAARASVLERFERRAQTRVLEACYDEAARGA
jgi:colanic acid/amylovoran biosynthesis glycosyltransferase